MELIAEINSFQSALSAFQGLSKNALSGSIASEYLKAEVNEEGNILFSGTDTDLSIQTCLDKENVQVITPGSICFRSNKLESLLGTLGNVKSVRLKKEENHWTKVMFGKSSFKITGVSPDQWPNILFSSLEGTPTITLPCSELTDSIERTIFATNTVDGKYLLSGVNCRNDESSFRMEATDGFRVALIKKSFGPIDFSALFPKKAATTLVRLLKGVEGNATLSQTENLIFVSFGTTKVSFRKIAGEFPDIGAVINIENSHKASIPLGDLRGAISRANLFADERNHSSISLTFREGELEIQTKNFEEGAGREFISAEYSGEEVTFKLKSTFILDFLSGLSGEKTVNIEFSPDITKQTVWKLNGEDDYKYLISKLV